MSSVFYAFFVFLVLVGNVEAFYSINYAAAADTRANLVNTGASFLEAPSAEHVADIYARLSGHAPLYKTENEKLPTIDALAEIKDQPVILEVHGGKLPMDVTQVVRSSAFEGDFRGPALDTVLKVLKDHGIEAKSTKMEGYGDASASVAEWLQSQNGRPVVILHHESPSSYHYIQRSLQTSAVPALTEFQISQYQICLWTGFLMVALIFSAICGMYNMEVIPDSLLFAKFISARTNKHD